MKWFPGALSLSSHRNHASVQGVAKDGAPGRGQGASEESKATRGLITGGPFYKLPTKEDPGFLLTMLVSLLEVLCVQEEKAH